LDRFVRTTLHSLPEGKDAPRSTPESLKNLKNLESPESPESPERAVVTTKYLHT